MLKKLWLKWLCHRIRHCWGLPEVYFHGFFTDGITKTCLRCGKIKGETILHDLSNKTITFKRWDS